MDLGLAGRRVLVTGASGNIGRAVALAFVAEHAHVALAYHSNEQAAQDIAAEITAKGGTSAVVWLDLSDTLSITQAVATVEQALGGLDVLVNNAVVRPPRASAAELFEDLPLGLMRRTVEANLIGQFALSQAAVRPMRASGWGRVVHVSSGLVVDGLPGSSAYTTPKAALHGLTRTMSRELAPAGILTNVVMAGLVPRPDLPQAVIDRASRSSAIGRPSRAHEIARLIVFLCSAANGNITGELIRADGHTITTT
jgi:NAD(P)-dependent dehydrogenase (short-subunit alcohol dehydrogenase family)